MHKCWLSLVVTENEFKMVEIILKDNLEKGKIEALIRFLRSMNIDAELKSGKKKGVRRKEEFSLSAGLWKNYDISASDLRKRSWNRNK